MSRPAALFLFRLLFLYTRRAKRYNVDNYFLNACKKKNMQWLETYAMAISMVGAMIFAVLITPGLL